MPSAMENMKNWECVDQEDGSVAVHVMADTSEFREIGCKLFFAFAEKGLPIFEMTSRKASLEDVFIELTETSIQSEAGQSAEEDASSEKVREESEVEKG